MKTPPGRDHTDGTSGLLRAGIGFETSNVTF
jgi:hypothetical protein